MEINFRKIECVYPTIMEEFGTRRTILLYIKILVPRQRVEQTNDKFDAKIEKNAKRAQKRTDVSMNQREKSKRAGFLKEIQRSIGSNKCEKIACWKK